MKCKNAKGYKHTQTWGAKVPFAGGQSCPLLQISLSIKMTSMGASKDSRMFTPKLPWMALFDDNPETTNTPQINELIVYHRP